MNRGRETARNDPVRVVAILPLTTAEESSAFLGDGISESVINSLSRLPQIKMLARTTTFRFRGPSVDLAALRRELGVDAVLMGTASQQGQSLVVQAELIDTVDNSQLWGQRYNNRRLADVFDVQEKIARAIVSGLRIELTAGEAGFAKHYTDDVDAYRAYVLGREYAQRRTVTDLERAVSYHQQAIDCDQQYALAWAGLTDAYLNLCARGALPYREGRRLAMEAAERARTLDPDLAEAHAAVGQTHVFVGPFDFESGDRALGRAIELNPVAPGTPVSGRVTARAGPAGRRPATAGDCPRSGPSFRLHHRFLAFAHLLQGDAAQAMTIYQTAASSGPLFATFWEADLFIRAGATDEGVREVVSAARTRDDDPYVRLNQAAPHVAKGRPSEALRVAEEFARQAASDPTGARLAARIYVALGDHDRGLDLLDRSMDGGAGPIFYKDEPLWQPVRKHPRFQTFLRRMRIPD